MDRNHTSARNRGPKRTFLSCVWPYEGAILLSDFPRHGVRIVMHGSREGGAGIRPRAGFAVICRRRDEAIAWTSASGTVDDAAVEVERAGAAPRIEVLVQKRGLVSHSGEWSFPGHPSIRAFEHSSIRASEHPSILTRYVITTPTNRGKGGGRGGTRGAWCVVQTGVGAQAVGWIKRAMMKLTGCVAPCAKSLK